MSVYWKPIILMISLVGLIGFFQNCTQAVPFGNTDYFQALVNSPVFPYELGVDQVAYMSCSEQEDVPNDGTFFTFRVGSFHSHGLRITEEYRNHIEKVDSDDVTDALIQAQASSNTRIQLSVRPLDNLQLMFRDEDNGESGLDGYDHQLFFPSMGDESLNSQLWSMNSSDYLRNFSFGHESNQYRFEGELLFQKSERMEQDLRAFFSGRGLLTVTFVNNGEVYPIGPGSLIELQDLAESGQSGQVNLPSPGGGEGSNGGSSLSGGSGSSGSIDGGGGSSSSFKVSAFQTAENNYSNNLATNVFGVAIKPQFKQPLFQGGSPGPDLPPRVLSSVQDVVIDDRKKGQVDNPWVCPESMQFMVVLPEHAIYQDSNSNTIVRCGMDPDPINPSDELKIIRQSLYAEDFYVDMVRKCIVPKPNHAKTGSCYGKDANTQTTYDINYDSFHTNGCGYGSNFGLCPHYASVCFRQ